MFITVSSCFVISSCVECGLFAWVMTNLRRGEEWLGRVLNIPPPPDAPPGCSAVAPTPMALVRFLISRGGMLWTESEKTRTPPEWVSVESKVTGMVIHFEHGGKVPSNSSFLCNLCYVTPVF